MTAESPTDHAGREPRFAAESERTALEQGISQPALCEWRQQREIVSDLMSTIWPRPQAVPGWVDPIRTGDELADAIRYTNACLNTILTHLKAADAS